MAKPLTWTHEQHEDENGIKGEKWSDSYLWAGDEKLIYEIRTKKDTIWHWQLFAVIHDFEYEELLFTGNLFDCMKHCQAYSDKVMVDGYQPKQPIELIGGNA